eukprot:scaffold42445_cov19-Tisochrysis_lutea.AAC.3
MADRWRRLTVNVLYPPDGWTRLKGVETKSKSACTGCKRAICVNQTPVSNRKGKEPAPIKYALAPMPCYKANGQRKEVNLSATNTLLLVAAAAAAAAAGHMSVHEHEGLAACADVQGGAEEGWQRAVPGKRKTQHGWTGSVKRSYSPQGGVGCAFQGKGWRRAASAAASAAAADVAFAKGWQRAASVVASAPAVADAVCIGQ